MPTQKQTGITCLTVNTPPIQSNRSTYIYRLLLSN